MFRSKFFLIAALAALSVLAVSCGGDSAGDATETGEVTITLSEFEFSPSNIKVKAGQKVTIILKNGGDKDHEFMIGRNVVFKDGAPNNFEHNLFEGAEVMAMRAGKMLSSDELMGMMAMDDDMAMAADSDTMKMGDDAKAMDMEMDGEEGHGFMALMTEGSDDITLTFTVPNEPGEWIIACFEDEGQHYDDGMKGKFTIES